jgi:hypothetical protein
MNLIQGLMQLPDEGRILILTLLTAGLAWLLTKINMGQYTEALAAAIAPIIITGIEMGLQMIPALYDNVVLSIIHLLVLFIGGSIGFVFFFKRVKEPKTLLGGRASG